jgi:hypothetical protein
MISNSLNLYLIVVHQKKKSIKTKFVIIYKKNAFIFHQK